MLNRSTKERKSNEESGSTKKNSGSSLTTVVRKWNNWNDIGPETSRSWNYNGRTEDGDFVEETTLVDGKKVLGLDSKRGISTHEKRTWKRIKGENKGTSANSLILACVRLLKQKILREEMVKISGKERSSSFYKNRISKKNWKKRANSEAKTQRPSKKVAEKPSRKEESKQAAKNMSCIACVNEQNTWASLHHFSGENIRQNPSLTLFWTERSCAEVRF